MGDFNISVFKDVNLNKQVTLDVDKNVNVDVDNNDILATAEADAEAFGSENALAEVDTYTFVNESGGTTTTITAPGLVNGTGNSSVFESTSNGEVSGPRVPVPLGASQPITKITNGLEQMVDWPIKIIQNFNPPSIFPQNTPIPVPNVASVVGGGILAGIQIPPPPTPAPIPIPNVFTATDKFLHLTGNIDQNPGPNVLLQYVLSADFEIDFGERTVVKPDGTVVVDNAVLTVAAGTPYLVEFDTTDGVMANPDDPIAFLFAGLPSDVSFRVGDHDDWNIISYNQTGASAQDPDVLNISEWTFDLDVEKVQTLEIPGQREAFAYSQSLSAIDLTVPAVPQVPFG